MSELTAKQAAQIERDIQQTLDDPMPRDLKEAIAARIEAHTMNMFLKHGDVMDCIDVAYLVIRDHLGRDADLIEDMKR